MSAPGTYSTSFLLRRLGVRTRITPEYKVSELTPVLVLADMSRSYGVEAVEARLVGLSDSAHNGTAVDWEIESRGQGGCIIESWGCTSNQAAATVKFEIRTSPRVSPSTPITCLQIGGETANSVLRIGYDEGCAGGGWPVPFASPTDRWYVPAGYYFHVQSNFTGLQTAYFYMVLREIPEPLGAA